MKKLICLLFILMLILTACAKTEQPAAKPKLNIASMTLCGENISSIYDDLSAPENGETRLDDSLGEALFPKKGGRYDVRVYVYYTEPEFLYYGHSVSYYENAPILQEFNEAFSKWYSEEYYELDRKMVEAEAAGEEYALGWEKHSANEVFYKIWAEEQTEETVAEYEKAQRRFIAASDAYYEWEYTSGDYDRRKIKETEFNRLKEAGYDLEPWDDSLDSFVGRLTGEQILYFEASDNCGYWIAWNEKPANNKADETKEVINLSELGDVIDEYVPGPGDVNTSGMVDRAKRDAQYADCLLDVSFSLVSMGEALFRYNGTTLYEMNKSEMMQRWWDSEDEWSNTHEGASNYPDDMLKWLKMEKGEEGAEIAEFIEFHYEISNAFDDWRGGAAIERAIEEEYKRLEEAGYPIVRTDSGFDAKLTQEQLINFPYDPHYGYMVGWRYEKDEFRSTSEVIEE